MLSTTIVNIVRIETHFDEYGDSYLVQEVIESFDGSLGDPTIVICDKAKARAEVLNKQHGGKYREYVTSRVD